MRKILQRHRCIIGVLREQKCDVCCLQEFWFNDNLRNLYQEELGHLYFINTLQRTRSEDGVAILLLKEKFHVVNQHNILFREHSKFGHDRVALCVLAQLANQNQTTNNSPPDSPPSFSGQSQGQGEGQVKSSKCFSPPMAFVTSHLTYPHHTLDEYSRLEQSKVLLRKSKEFVEKSCPPNTPIIISGDFNGTLEDQVCEEMRASGYMDAFSQATGIQQNRITHCDHRKNQKGVDYIWLSHTYAGDGTGADNEAERSLGNSRNPEEQSKQNMLPYENNHLMELNTIEAYLLPRDIPCDTKMHRPRFRSPLSNTLDLDLMGEGGGENNNNNNSNNQQGVEGRKKRFMQDEMVSPGKLTLNSLDSFEDYDEHSFASELDWMSWCNLSDHRPMVVHFDIYASSLEEDK
jgi:endonuclease/exonuclease/phosphatase family metal-dependent hydrolase